MTDSVIQAMPQALLVEIESLRDQRDLYRSLLLSELEPLAACMTHALETVERIRAALRVTTRDDNAFRGKIERLQQELNSLSEAMVGLHLPSVSSRVVSAAYQSGSYQAVDLGLEGSLLAGLLGGYVTGLISGILISIPAMIHREYLTMPLLAGLGVLGGL